jgi:hypothetical protein
MMPVLMLIRAQWLSLPLGLGQPLTLAVSLDLPHAQPPLRISFRVPFAVCLALPLRIPVLAF